MSSKVENSVTEDLYWDGGFQQCASRCSRSFSSALEEGKIHQIFDLCRGKGREQCIASKIWSRIFSQSWGLGLWNTSVDVCKVSGDVS
ncbi:unnamed protein product [Brassica rapa]|uniref:Uncharacterized protein n=1 Tax=Brassica campestris TaxID=3711 RepID=A0A3P6A205_BRACM|nr:unnamed protein product [Brassica rapa]VDC83749.1 unnamed protein product [Brassica rapa]